MLQTHLLEIINSGQAWAFVGSGPSSYAGAPSWSELVKVAAEDPAAAALKSDAAFTGAQQSGNYPRCLSLLQTTIGREALEEHVRHPLSPCRLPANFIGSLRTCPFRVTLPRITTLSLRRTFRRETGWISVGNTPDEVRKVSGGVSRIVWHIHGALNLPQKLRVSC